MTVIRGRPILFSCTRRAIVDAAERVGAIHRTMATVVLVPRRVSHGQRRVGAPARSVGTGMEHGKSGLDQKCNGQHKGRQNGGAGPAVRGS